MKSLQKSLIELLATAVELKIENEKLKAENKALNDIIEILKNQTGGNSHG